MPKRYAGLTPDQADSLMTSIISQIVYDELIAARNMSAEEWAWTDLNHRSGSIAGAIWCVLQNRLSGAPHVPFQNRGR
jgi:hypothetical protein